MSEMTELTELDPDEVDLVRAPASGTAFLIAKSAAEKAAKAEESTKEQNDLPDSDFAYIEPGGHKDDEGKTVPRSLRHFPINDAAHVRNALARASQSPFGDKAMPKIREAAKKFGIDAAKAADEGNPDEPGSRAWEQMDAAQAQQMIDLLVALRAKLKEACEREQDEVDAGDTDDIDDVEDLGDVDCALDCALTLMSRFLVNEQTEASEPDEDDAEESPTEEADEPEKDESDEDAAKTALTAEQVQAMIAANNEQVVAAIRESLAKAAEEREIPGTDTVQAPAEDDESDDDKSDEPESKDFEMVKSAFAEALQQVVGEQEATVKAALAALEGRLAVVESTPAAGNVLLNGATGMPGLAERSPGQEDPVEALVKAAQAETDPQKKQDKSYEAALAHMLHRPRPARTSPLGADPAEVLARFTN